MSKPAQAIAQIEVSLPDPYVLIVDDDEVFLATARDYFLARGYGVDIARTPEEAKNLIQSYGPERYLLIATDIDFAGLSKIRGDRFVLENLHLLGKAKKVVISGGQSLVEERVNELKAAGVSFLGKPPWLPKRLEELTKEESERRENGLHKAIQKETQRITGAAAHITVAVQGGGAATATALAPALKEIDKPRPLHDLVVGRLKQTLVKWLKTRQEPDKPVLSYGKQVFSANDLVKEVNDETEVGLEHVEMLLEEFEHSLRVDKDASQLDDDNEHEE